MSDSELLSFALEQDFIDVLKDFRNEFHIPLHEGKPVVYFTGNSLGLQPRATEEAVMTELRDWATHGVEGHFRAKNPWFSYHEWFSGPVARLVGALPNEVVVMNQLTSNLHFLLVSFYRPDAVRYKIITEAKSFPSDRYAIESQIRLHGLDPSLTLIEVPCRPGEQVVREEDVYAAISLHANELALVFIGGVNYYSGQVFPMAEITKRAHEAGAICGFDLAHAAGNIRLSLHDWKVDFASWCSYKYLNSGPGSVAGAFVHEKHAQSFDLPRLAGWWGNDKKRRFLMEPEFVPISGAEGWQVSNAPVLSMAAHKAAMEIFDRAGMEKLAAKGLALSGFLLKLLDRLNVEKEQVIDIITPREDSRRGCQVSMLVKESGRRVFEKLTARGVVADWREPDVIRVAPVPLYNSFMDVFSFYQILKEVITETGK